MIQQAIDQLKLFVEGKLASWSQFWSTKYNVLTAAVQFLYDFRTAALSRFTEIENTIASLTGGASPTISRGAFKVEDVANLDLTAVVGNPTVLQLSTALFQLHGLTPETGTYQFELLGGSLDFDNNGTVQTFDAKDTIYVKVEGSGTGISYMITNKPIANDPTITVTDLNVADPNDLLELSPAFMADLFPQ
jgi:hypothetical protein